jgi:hypothetical protein
MTLECNYFFPLDSFAPCILDDDHSTVSAMLTSSGILNATVSTASETYYVEPASQNISFPAVIYKASDVLHPDPHEEHGSSCASHQLYLKQFEHFHCHQEDDGAATRSKTNRNSSDAPAVIRSCQEDNNNNKHSVPSEGIEPNQLIDQTLYSGWNRRHQKKKKRRSTIDHRKTTCMLNSLQKRLL